MTMRGLILENDEELYSPTANDVIYNRGCLAVKSSKALHGLWLGDTCYRPKMYDESLQSAWENYCKNFDQENYMKWEDYEKFFMEYENPEWVVYQKCDYYATGISFNIFFVVNKDTVVRKMPVKKNDKA